MASPQCQRTLLVVSVFIDLIGVALVVPLLPMRLQELGISKRTAGVLSSAYSMAQILGGLILGVISDRCLGRRGLLLVSFVGAALAYALLGLPQVTLELVFLSRIIVGLTKQTMTASAALMTELTSEGSERMCWIGRLSSAAQTAWISGQALGGVLNRGAAWAPAAAAVGLYAADFLLVRAALPGEPKSALDEKAAEKQKAPGSRSWLAAFASRDLARIVVVRLLEQFASQAIFATRGLYELERWSLTRAEIGYFSSFKALVGVFASWHLAGALSRRFDIVPLLYGATGALVASCLLEAVSGEAWLQTINASVLGQEVWSALSRLLPEKLSLDPSLLVFCAACFPVNAASVQVMSIALRSRFTELVPKANTAAALSSLDVLQSAVGVVAPLAGGFLFNGLTTAQTPLMSASIHATVVLLLLGCFPLPALQSASRTKKVE